jgi:GntR family transcriptional regulator
MDIIKDPIYQQLNKILRELIVSGDFKPGDQFLTERKICERFDVSRATANKALSNLVSERLLEFKKGVGTFVAEKFIDFDLRSLISFTNITRQTGKKPSTRVLHFERLLALDAKDNVMDELNVKPDEVLYFVERLRLVDDVPSILERRYIVERFCPNMNKNSLEGSLFTLWIDDFKLNIIGANQIIKSVIINKQDARVLEFTEQESGFLIYAIGYVEGEKPVPLWTERTLFRGTKYEFRNIMGPVSSDAPGTRLFINY